MNTPIQGLAADIMKYVTGRVEQLLQLQQQRAFALRDSVHAHTVGAADGASSAWGRHVLERPLRAQVVLQIHDELLLEVHRDDISPVLELVLPVMQRAWGLLLLETDCLDRYAALCELQKHMRDPQSGGAAGDEAALRIWASETAKRGPTPRQTTQWFALPPQFEWLRPLLQRELPTSAKVGRDWCCC